MGIKCRIRFPHCYAPLVVMALLFLSGTEGQQDYDGDQTRQRLMKLFEEALVNSSESLYTLQGVYFNPSLKKSPASVSVDVTVTVDKINQPATPLDCYGLPAFIGDSTYSSRSRYALQLCDLADTPQLSDLLTTRGPVGAFCVFESTFYSIMTVLASSSDSNIDNGYDRSRSVSDYIINIHVKKELEEMPCTKDAAYALRTVLVWAKAYARAGGMPVEKQEMDRSSVSCISYDGDHYGCDMLSDNPLVDPSNMNIGMLITFIFIFSNLLVLSLTLLLFRTAISLLKRQGKQVKLLFKASAMVLTCVNLGIFISDIILNLMFTDCSIFNYYLSNLNWFLIFMNISKLLLVFVILILETPAICYTVYKVDVINKKCHRIAHALDFCQLIWFVHHLVNGTIISMIYFVVSPAQTLGVVTLLFSIIASAIAFVYIIIYKGCSRTSCKYTFCTFCNGIIICGLLIVVTLLYITFVDNGLKSAGMGGLILSLVPPLIVFMIGLFIKRRYSRSTSIASSENETEDLEQGQRSNAPINDGNSREDSERQPLISHHRDQM